MKFTIRRSNLSLAVVMALTASTVYAAVPATSAFNTDPVEKHVADHALEVFGSAEQILCDVAQLKTESFINKGAYVALMDQNKCEKDISGGDAASAGGEGSSSSDTVEYARATVEVKQEDSNSPVVAKVWIAVPADGDEPARTFPVKITVKETPTDANPLGRFRLDWGVDDTDRGFLQSVVDSQGRVVLQEFEEGNYYQGQQGSTQVSLIKTGASSGLGRAVVTTGGQSSGMRIVFNDTNFLKTSASIPPVCLNRAEPINSVYRYGLYDSSTGNRISANSGFQIVKDGYYGWAGYWGIWLPPQAAVSHGDTIQKVGENGIASDSYTVFKAGGKLTKNKKETITLAQMRGTPINVWTSLGGFQIEWNGTKFIKTQSMNCGNDGCSFGEASGDFTPGQNDYELNGHSDALGGSVRIPLRDNSGNLATLSGSSAAIIYKRTTVMPGDAGVPTEFKCYDSCISANGTSSSLDYSDPNLLNTVPASVTPAATYSFTGSGMMLKQGSSPIQWNSSWSNESQYSGALVPADQVNNLACDWNQNQTCPWKAWSLDTFYTWETGRNSWNQLTLLKDVSGNRVSFAPPLQVKYADATGRQFRLEYSGFGNLQGIPGKCVNAVTNQETSCNGDNTRFIPEFNIDNGPTVVGADNTPYLLKQLGIEQRMKQNTEGACVSMVTEALALPEGSDWANPSIGESPALTDAPKVIDGVIQ